MNANQKPHLRVISSQNRTETRQNKPQNQSISQRYAKLTAEQKTLIDNLINAFFGGAE